MGVDIVQVDIIEADSSVMRDWRISGITADRNLWIKVEGAMTIVRDSLTDEVLVRARGFAKAMQALADMCQHTVIVSCDPGVGNAATAKVTGCYEPVRVGSEFAADLKSLLTLEPVAEAEAKVKVTETGDIYERALFLGYTRESAGRVADCFYVSDFPGRYGDECPEHLGLRMWDGVECEACQVIRLSGEQGYTPQGWAQIQVDRATESARIQTEWDAEPVAEVVEPTLEELAQLAADMLYAAAIDEDPEISNANGVVYRDLELRLIKAINAAYPDVNPRQVRNMLADNEPLAYLVKVWREEQLQEFAAEVEVFEERLDDAVNRTGFNITYADGATQEGNVNSLTRALSYAAHGGDGEGPAEVFQVAKDGTRLTGSWTEERTGFDSSDYAYCYVTVSGPDGEPWGNGGFRIDGRA